MKAERNYLGWGLVALGVAFLVAPLVAAAAVGIYQLWGWAFILIFAVTQAAGWLLLQRAEPRVAPSVLPPLPLPGGSWSPEQEAAWEAVVKPRIARAEAGEMRLELQPLVEEGRALLEDAARHYHPKSKRPMLAVSPLHLARAIEATAAEIADRVAAVPGIQEVPIDWMIRGGELGRIAAQVYRYGDIAYSLYNPARLVTKAPSQALFQQLAGQVRRSLDVWLISLYLRLLGEQAIRLYSGRIALTESGRDAERGALTASGRAELDQAREQQVAAEREPLRILVVGQAKAGKSSLVNALFGEERAGTDVLPATGAVTRYEYAKPGWVGPPLIVYDTAGYDQAGTPLDFSQQALRQALLADVILLVVRANSSARRADRLLLESLKQQLARTPHRRPPPVIAVVTHIDLLRPPREWEPPYDVEQPRRDKEHSIVDACAAVAEDLAPHLLEIVPVCTAPERLYLIERLLASLTRALEDEAKRAQLTRIAEQELRGERRELFRRQLAAAGRFLLRLP